MNIKPIWFFVIDIIYHICAKTSLKNVTNLKNYFLITIFPQQKKNDRDSRPKQYVCPIWIHGITSPCIPKHEKLLYRKVPRVFSCFESSGDMLMQKKILHWNYIFQAIANKYGQDITITILYSASFEDGYDYFS